MKTFDVIKIGGLALAAMTMIMAAACAGPHKPHGHHSGPGNGPPLPVSGAGADNSGPPAQDQGGTPGVFSVSQVYSDIHGLKGKVVPVQGMFMGWSGCRDNTQMRTRSDWVLSDGPRCVFVIGPPPFGLDPKNKRDRGKPAQIQALVLLENGKLLLRRTDGP